MIPQLFSQSPLRCWLQPKCSQRLNSQRLNKVMTGDNVCQSTCCRCSCTCSRRMDKHHHLACLCVLLCTEQSLQTATSMLATGGCWACWAQHTAGYTKFPSRRFLAVCVALLVQGSCRQHTHRVSWVRCTCAAGRLARHPWRCLPCLLPWFLPATGTGRSGVSWGPSLWRSCCGAWMRWGTTAAVLQTGGRGRSCAGRWAVGRSADRLPPSVPCACACVHEQEAAE